MHGAELRILDAVDGTPVCNVSVDLSAMQLAACARCVDAARVTRFRGAELGTDDVLSLQALTAVADELHRLADHEAHGTLVLPLARFAALHDAMTAWSEEIAARDWAREEEAADKPVIDAMLAPMAELREQAVKAALGRSAAQAL